MKHHVSNSVSHQVRSLWNMFIGFISSCRRFKTLAFFLLIFTCYFLLLLRLPRHPIVNIHIYSGYSQPTNAVREEKGRAVTDPCAGRRVYVYDLPSRFNLALADKCNKELVGWLEFCRHLENHGLGEAAVGNDSTTGWYRTDAYMLEVIFHSRILNYTCRAEEAARADAFFVPYYTGIDALRYLYSRGDRRGEDRHGEELGKWLAAQESWKRWNGKDHFMVMGRTSWDFVLSPGWGTGIQELGYVKNMTSLYIERNPWQVNQFAVPYPTSFHPSTRAQLEAWVERVKSSTRTHLFAFSGGPRANIPETKRGVLLRQCEQTDACIHVDCGSRFKCGHDPRPSVDVFLRSQFCLQPRGDTPSRRSTFDSLISGCIPVFFHNDSAYTQYLWHLPTDPATYSVYIPEESIREEGGVQVEKVLRSYSSRQVEEMRNRIVSLILPRVIYRLPPGGGGELNDQAEEEDAFDISVRKVLERVADLKLR